MQTLMQFYTI